MSRKQYTNAQGEPISRQRYHQLQREKEGKCIICSAPVEEGRKDRCTACADKNNEGGVKRYRRKRGIPLDLPVRGYKKQK